MWHAKTKELQEQGKIRLVGIIEEQHPDRARLFMQWKAMNWPILVDSQNLLEMTAVPVTLLIDENGVVRKIGPDDADVKAFVESPVPERGSLSRTSAARPDTKLLRIDAETGNVKALRDFESAIILWGEDTELGSAIRAYRKAVDLEPEDGATYFRLGVAYRKRYDSALRTAGDFASAVEHWGRALALDPNQYIWRRRIQQYGPRLDKPYPFYDWVTAARKELRDRGEEPPWLIVEPSGAEIASPSKEFGAAKLRIENPDPEARIHRDTEGFIRVECTTVPMLLKAGEPVRVHVVFRTNEAIKAHWNNEAEDLVFWIDPPEGWAADGQYHRFPNPREPVDTAERRIEFELKSPANGVAGAVTIPGYALYYACEDVNGVCVYRRQEIPVTVEVK